MTIKNSLKNLDLFGESISLCFSGKKKFKTLIGTLLSFLMILAISTFSYSKITSVFNRSNIYMLNLDEIEPIPHQLYFKNRFAFSLSPPELNDLSGKRYFEFVGTLGHQILLEDGTLIKSKIYYNFTQCKASDFPMFSEEDLIKKGLKTWLCLNATEEDDLSTRGTYNNEIYQYIQISVSRCSNTSENANDQDLCANDEEFQLALKNIKIYVNLIIVNSLINLSSYEKSIVPYFETMSYLINLNNYYIQKEVYFTPISIRTDETISFNFLRNEDSVKELNDWFYEQKYDDYPLNEAMINNGKIEYTSLYMRTGSMRKICSRKYDTFQDFLQTLGSFFSIFFVVFKNFNRVLTSSKISKKIAFAIYSFEGEIVEKNRNCFKKWLFYLYSRIFWKKDSKDNFYGDTDEIVKKITEDIDIIQILMKLKEFDIVKSLLLTPEQKCLLNLTAKPSFKEGLHTPSLNKIKRVLKKNSNLMKNDVFKRKHCVSKPSIFISQTKKAYEKIVKEKNNDINNKLVNMLDKDMIRSMRDANEVFEGRIIMKGKIMRGKFDVLKRQLSTKNGHIT